MNFSPDPALYPDPTGRADRICRFVRKLKLWEGDFAGQPFKLHRFQETILRRIYGPSDDAGNRLVRIACIWIPRGNAKTTLAAALGLAHFLGPEAEAGGQVVMAAADRENAGIAFNCAHQMTLQDDALSARVRPVESRKSMSHPKTKGTLKAISHEAYSKHGLNVSFFLADEIHAWPAVEGRKLFSVVTDSMVKRSHPLTIIISTAGEGQGGVAFDMWEYSRKVASGEIDDPTFAPIIFAAPPAADWRDETTWRAANPAIKAGFCSISEMRTKAKRIQHFPADIANFKRFHLNQWQEGVAEPWLSPEIYDAAQPARTAAELVGKACYAGIDLSSVEDLTAFVAVFPEGSGETRTYDVSAMFFLPEENIARKSDADQANYLRWAEDGFLTLTDGNVVDQAAIIAHVVEFAKAHGLKDVAIDRWNSEAVNTALMTEGIQVYKFGQGFASMAAPVKELKRAILAGRFRHGGNPILRMCFANVVTETDAAENEKFTKDKAKSRGRIDGATAAAMAVSRALTMVEEEDSIYASRPVFDFV